MSWYEDPYDYYEEQQEEPEYEFWEEEAPVAKDGLTLFESIKIAEEAFPKGFMSAEDIYEYEQSLHEIAAERAAERAYEDAGWLEALMDSYVESGFITRY